MAAAVVTFAVQIGANGECIARAVSERLGYRYLDREVISEAAALAGVSAETVAAAERWPSFIERMLERLALSTAISEGVLPGTPSGNPAISMMTSADYRQLIEQVVMSLAEQGECVIVGHAGQAILAEHPRTFKVLVNGSPERRAGRLVEEQGYTEKEAAKEVSEHDRQRSDFFRHVYGLDWLDCSAYDLAVNTDDLEVETAVEMVLRGVESIA